MDKLTSVVSYLEDIEKGQLRELHDLRTASLRQSMTNLQHIKEKITRQLARPSSARRSASAAAELPTALAAPTTSARKSSQPTQTSDLHEEARRLGQVAHAAAAPPSCILLRGPRAETGCVCCFSSWSR